MPNPKPSFQRDWRGVLRPNRLMRCTRNFKKYARNGIGLTAIVYDLVILSSNMGDFSNIQGLLVVKPQDLA